MFKTFQSEYHNIMMIEDIYLTGYEIALMKPSNYAR